MVLHDGGVFARAIVDQAAQPSGRADLTPDDLLRERVHEAELGAIAAGDKRGEGAVRFARGAKPRRGYLPPCPPAPLVEAVDDDVEDEWPAPPVPSSPPAPSAVSIKG